MWVSLEESALLYHRRPPTEILAAAQVEVEPDKLHDNSPVLPRHFRLHKCKQGGDIVTGRTVILANDDVRISYVVALGRSPLFRNATGDELIYVEAGSARLESVFGVLKREKATTSSCRRTRRIAGSSRARGRRGSSSPRRRVT